MKIKQEWRIGDTRIFITEEGEDEYWNFEIEIDPWRFLYVCVGCAVVALLLLGLSK